MKSNILQKLAILLTLGMQLIDANVRAQITCTAPSQPDIYWFGSPNGIKGLNTAIIGHGNVLPGTQFLYTGVPWATHPPVAKDSIYFKDPANPSGTLVDTIGGIETSTPDVILGNYDGSVWCSGCSPDSDYVAVVAYVNDTGDIEVDYYHIVDAPGSSTFSDALVLRTFPFNGNGYLPRNVHMDIIGQASNTTLTGLPLCNTFVITFDDYSTPGSPNVYGALGTVNSMPLTITPTQMNTGGTYGYSPAVAAVERYVPGGAPLFHNIGLFTFVDVGGNALYYDTLDFTSTSPVSVVTMDGGSYSSSISYPRISAFDDYTMYHNGYANYKIAAQVYEDTASLYRYEVRTYDDAMGAGNYFPISGVIDISPVGGGGIFPGPTYNDYKPTVCYFNQNFVVTHFMQFPAAPPNDVLFAEATPQPSSLPLYGNTCYWVNSNTSPPSAIDAYITYVSASSSAPNAYGDGSIYAWAQEDHTLAGTRYDVYYKELTPLSPMSFRSATGIGNVDKRQWRLYPDPSSTSLTVSVSAGNIPDSYNITDMSGRILAHGNMGGNSTNIDVRSLAPGTYVLAMYRAGSGYGQELFIKE